jgi:hypothetical protein
MLEALDEARLAGSRLVEPGHLVLAILRQSGSTAAVALNKLGADSSALRDDIQALLAHARSVDLPESSGGTVHDSDAIC